MVLRRMVAAGLLLSAAMVAPGVAAPSGAASASTGFTVDSLLDSPDDIPGDGACATSSGTCTLRAAVDEANSGFATDTITVPVGTIVLDTELTISRSANIVGQGARSTILSGTGDHGMVRVSGGSVVLERFAVQGLDVTGAFPGVAVSVTGGSVVMRAMAIRDNRAAGSGSTAGAVRVNDASLTIENSSITGNKISTSTGSVTGGGVAALGGATLAVRNSTIADNTAERTTTDPTDPVALGGGLYSDTGASVSVAHSTIAGNKAVAALPSGGRGGNVYRQSGAGGSVKVSDSVIAGGAASGTTSNSLFDNCATTHGGAAPAMTGHNIVSDGGCGPTQDAITVADPALLPLTGSTPTDVRPVSAGSPALDRAVDCPAGGTDQRGQPRPLGAGCDLGAAELGADVVVAAATSNASPPGGSEVVASAVITDNGPDDASAVRATLVPTGSTGIGLVAPSQGSCTVTNSVTAPVTCDLGALGSGQSATVQVVLRAPRTGSLIGLWDVTAAEPDPQQDNNAASVTADVVASQVSPPGRGGKVGRPPRAPKKCGVRILGSPRADRLRGTTRSERIEGRAGSDSIRGNGGADCLDGGRGNDTISGGSGADRIAGGPGADRINAMDGIGDRVDCGPGRDRVVADRRDRLVRCEKVERR